MGGPPYQFIYLEPHLDDVALSCGGALLDHRSRGESVLVATVFDGAPTADVVPSAFARGQHERWGAVADPMAARLAEQRAALAILGADWHRLGYLDAIYRGDQYRSDRELFGAVKAGDSWLIESLARAVRRLASEHPLARWRVPLAAGNHVDHQIALAASAGLPNRLAYEDFPYAQRPGIVAARVAALGATPGDLVPIDRWLDQKIAAIACYRSQIGTLFGGDVAMARAVRESAAARGGEQRWRLPEMAGGRVLD